MFAAFNTVAHLEPLRRRETRPLGGEPKTVVMDETAALKKTIASTPFLFTLVYNEKRGGGFKTGR